MILNTNTTADALANTWIQFMTTGQGDLGAIVAEATALKSTTGGRERALAAKIVEASQHDIAKKIAVAGKQRAFTAPVMPAVNLHDYDGLILNSSGGKDSQAQIDFMVKRCIAEGFPLDRVVVLHADLGRMEWFGTMELAREQARAYGLRFEVVRRTQQADLLEHISYRADQLAAKGKDAPPWPSNGSRYCTSDWKRGPAQVFYTAYCKELREKLGREDIKILSCMGIRAQESSQREKHNVLELLKCSTKPRQDVLKRAQANGTYDASRLATHTDKKGNVSTGLRLKTVHRYYPIFDWDVGQVWDTILDSGVRYHYAYRLGMPRLSCIYCVFAPEAALVIAGLFNRPLLDDYIAVETRTGKTFRKNFSLTVVRDRVDCGDVDEITPELAAGWTL